MIQVFDGNGEDPACRFYVRIPWQGGDRYLALTMPPGAGFGLRVVGTKAEATRFREMDLAITYRKRFELEQELVAVVNWDPA